MKGTAVKRATRSVFQVGLAEGLIQFLEAFLVEFDEAQHVAALWLAAVLVTFAQNWLEDGSRVPALLKNEKGAVDLMTVLVVLAIVAVALWLFVNFSIVEK